MATLEQIQAKMDKLKAQAEALAAKNARAIVDKIRGLMAQHGLTTKDIEGDVKTKRAAKGVKGSAANGVTASEKSVGKVAAKYQDPKSGATWTGRGRAPAWIASAKDRSKFLIDAVAVAASAQAPVGNVKGKGKVNAAAAKKAASVGATTVRKGAPKSEQAARYRDPKSGATWSGRGRAPLWIAGAKDRNKFLIDGAQAVAAVAKPKAVVKKAATTKAATTKAATTKAATTKAATTKAATTKAATTKAATTKAATTKAATTKAATTKAATTKAATTKAATTKAATAKAATAKAPAAKKVSAAKKVEIAPALAPVVSEKPVATKPEKIVAKKPVAKKPAVSAKPKAVKKAPVAKTVEADVVAAASSVPAAAPVASTEVAA